MSWANGGFYIGELQAGYGVFGMKLSLPVVGTDLRDWMRSVVSCGARAVAAGRVARVITENMDLFLRSRPPRAEVAILYKPLAHMVGGQQTFTAEGQAVGVNNLSESLQDVYKAFFEQGIPVDFLYVMDLTPERWSQYKLRVVPYPVMMSQTDVKKIIAYVEAGRMMVSEARCGWVDERGFSSQVIPGGGLHELLGCRESYLMPLPKPSTLKIRGAHEELPPA
ncbi:MAG: hypothetical protein A2W25_11440 [candidate division Zixibacteria bacterium RBG_16_53_22]|nr:MAG: hypothetical protein A2W25_11440 [candidate division Zixibacteria bacterium RBG_16_53_22]HCS47412.1 hypothetical protein [Candidatus Aminicenantes bacterium]